MQRRNFLIAAGVVGVGFVGLRILTRKNAATEIAATAAKIPPLPPGYGALVKDPNGILNLPEGFSYKIISRKGEQMADGLMLPGMPDGMATFRGPDGKVIVVRNHE